MLKLKDIILILSVICLWRMEVYSFADLDKDLMHSFPKKKISIELKDMDIVEVLKIISKESGLNIVVAGNVRGNITMFLTDTDIREAFETIMESSNLAYEWKDQVIQVMTAQNYEHIYGQTFHNKTEMKIFPLRYAQAETVHASVDQIKSTVGKVMIDARANALVVEDTQGRLEQINQLIQHLDVPMETKIFTLGYAKVKEIEPMISETIGTAGQVKVDERTNILAVTTTTERLNQITKLVTALDTRKGAVKIEAKILQITLNDTHKMGVDWEYLFGERSNFHGLDFKTSFQLAGRGALSPGGEVSVGTLTKGHYQAFIQLLKTIGETNLLSSPSITANHGEEAKILVGTNQAYVTQTVVQGTTNATTSESVNFVDVGVKLHVTPFIAPDGYVNLKVKPEVSSVASTLKTANGNTVPIISTSEAETTVLVKNENTVVIAGLIEDKKSNTENKVPFLGELPVLGGLFRGKENELKKTELVIFLTPKVVEAGVSDYETRKYWHSEQGDAPGTIAEQMKQLYYDYIYQRIASVPVPLQDSVMSTIAKVSLRFVVKRNGDLGNIQVMRGSTSDERLRLAAVNKVIQAAPFPEFPEEIVENKMILKVDIYFGGRQNP